LTPVDKYDNYPNGLAAIKRSVKMRRSISDFYPVLIPIALVLPTLMVMSVDWIIPTEIDTALNKQRRLCDEAVNDLLYSKDLALITRAGIIIRKFDCSITKRMP